MKTCCFCQKPKPRDRKGWVGLRVMSKGQKSHWACPECRETNDVVEHAHAVAEGIEDCISNAEAHGRRSRTVQPLVGASSSED